tara:strand:+ start:1402 stop:2070 length:669 start_codon:yes stop_codon:yes gene_type:complete
MLRKLNKEFKSGAVRIYNPVSQKLQQTLVGDGSESFGFSWDADGEWLAVGCPTYDHVKADGTIVKNLGRVKIYKSYHQKNASGQLLYYDSSGNETTTSANNGPYIKYERFGVDILGEIDSETNKVPKNQFFGYCVKIEKPTREDGQKLSEDRYPHIAIGAPFRGYDHTGDAFRHEAVGAIYLYHPIYLNETVDSSVISDNTNREISKNIYIKANESKERKLV